MLTRKNLLAVVALAATAGVVFGASELVWQFPTITGHGAVVRLPDASDQPREGSKICVDVTKGGPRDTINPAIEKVARFVNIYSGAGKSSASVNITVILHGDATLVALNDEAYSERFQTSDNPNLPLFEKLRAAGVELLVCGQALAHADASHDEVADQVEIAVSGLTVNVNRQHDGYAFIPLH